MKPEHDEELKQSAIADDVIAFNFRSKYGYSAFAEFVSLCDIKEILTLVLDYEATGRQAALISTQLNNHQVISKVMEIEYRMGGSSTNSYLAAIEKQERLENQLIQTQIAQQESLRKILSLTGFTTKGPDNNI